MKDIDFDELDRAVSSVLEPNDDAKPSSSDTNKTEATPQADQPEPVAETTPAPTTPAVETPVETTPVAAEAEESTAPSSVETEAATASITAKTPLAVKRRGQFMDVVHPSSDMTNKSEELPATPPRVATLQPLSTTPITPETTDQPTMPETEVSPESTESQLPFETVEPVSTDRPMPDPLDVMQQQEDVQAPVETPGSEGTEEEPAVAPSDSPEEAVATPFLADTKVDKRPLDAFSTEAPEADPATEPKPEEPQEAAVAPSEPLPPELQADIVAVETPPTELALEAADKEPVQPEQPEPSEQPSNPEDGPATSIPQQYASSEAKADDDHAIFDTKEYHQPLAPSKPKKRGLPGWLVALVVLVLLAGLSAAGGYFWFYYGL